MRRRTPILLAALAAPLLTTGLAAPAQAAEPVHPARVPDCVLTDLNDDGASDYVIVTNACRSSVRVRPVIDDYPDPDCVTIAPTKSSSFHWYYPGRYTGLERC
jgi:hypothetical protein